MILTKRRLLAAAAVFLLCCAAAFGAWWYLAPAGEAAEEAFSVRFLNVGQGDCALIACGGHMALIDAGPGAHAEKTVQQLRDLGVRDLELALATHGHEDHAGGMAAVLRSFPVGQLVLPVEDNRSGFWLDMLAAAPPVTEVEAGWRHTLGEAVITVLYPTADQRAAASDLNDTSLAILVEYRDVKFYLAGDCGTAAEAALLESNNPGPVTVCKASHHGSRDSNSAALLDALQPDYCVISCAAGNDYGHPHGETLLRLAARDITVLRTDTMGTVGFVYEAGLLRPVTQY